jgi:hypothetical protein
MKQEIAVKTAQKANHPLGGVYFLGKFGIRLLCKTSSPTGC